MKVAKPFPFEEATIASLQEQMRSGRLTSTALTTAYLARIREIDGRGPTLRAVLETNPDALSIARALDEERRTKGARGSLHGIPVMLKDNIDTADRMTTTAGSLALAGSIALQDSFVARKLRAAGAVLLGKASMSEWANFRSSRSSSGWCGRGGQGRNPYVLDRNPGGSSSGPGIAAAANLCAVAVGTETNGSIMSPASMNALVGIKPTCGLVSRAGIIPISSSQDTAGPMARSVADAAALLGVLAGPDPQDPVTADAREIDYTRVLDADGLKGARIGVARKLFGFDKRVDLLMEESLSHMRQRGAVLIEITDGPAHGGTGNDQMEVLLHEFKAGLNAYLAALGPRAPVKSLEEVIAFNQHHADTELQYFDQATLLQAQEKGPLTTPAYVKALAHCRRWARAEGIDATMDKHHLDALVAPSGGPAWTVDLVYADHPSGGTSGLAAVAGYPNISVPAGFVRGLPVGISFFGRAWSEPTLIKIAYAFEQATHARQPPRFIPTLQ